MSQTASSTTTQQKSGAKKDLLCKTFTDSQLSVYIDPQWLFLQLQTSGLLYQPQHPMALQARQILVEDIKAYIVNYYKASDVDITQDETVAKQINTWFESALIKSNPWIAQQSGAISQERLQELMCAGFGGFGFGGGFGSQMMPGMMGGMGMNMPGMGMGGMNMPGMGFGGGMMGGGMPMWNAKKDDKEKAKGTGGFNPFGNPMMGGMGGMPGMGGMMPGMNPMMMGGGMPGMMPGMGFGNTCGGI